MAIERAPAAISMGSRAPSRIAWSLCAATLALVVCAVILSVFNRYDPWELTFLAAEVMGALVGGLVASRRPANPVGWFIAGHAFCFSLGEFARQYAIYGLLIKPGALPLAGAVASLAYWIWYPGLILVFALLPLYFPDGRLVSRCWRPVSWFAFFVAAIVAGHAAIAPGDVEIPGLPNPLGIEGLRSFSETSDAVILTLLLSVGLASAASMVVRFRRSRGEERQQIKWFVYAVVLNVFAFPVSNLFLQTLSPVAAPVLHSVCLGSLWGAIAVAILRYRLYDIDLIINRTLVYGSLSACVVGIYVLVVGYLGTLFRVDDNLAISLVTTGVVAVLFAPLRDRLQRGVNRLMYGERDDPYAVLSRLGQHLETAIAPEAALSTIVETVANALKLPYVAIELNHDGESRKASEYGTPTSETLILPLTHQSDEVGRMLVAPRSPGEAFSSLDKRLLDDLARQAGTAAHATRLTADLRYSRARLVNAREEERRRLRRDLHDGLGPALGGLTLGLDAARSALPVGSEAIQQLLSELKAQTQEAVIDIRRLVHDLRPPTLDDLGLSAAIRQQAAKHGRVAQSPQGDLGSEINPENNGLAFSVEACGPLPPLPAAVEVAAYRVALEAITNVSRHAKANSCQVSLSFDEARSSLTLEVVDDGIGIPAKRRAGVGTSSMRERAEELGGSLAIEPAPQGGTRVLAHLPLPTKKET